MFCNRREHNEEEQAVIEHHQNPDFHRSNSNNNDKDSASEGENVPERFVPNYTTFLNYKLIEKYYQKKLSTK